MKFNSGAEMLQHICSGKHLYSKSQGIYVCRGGYRRVLSMYRLTVSEVLELIAKSRRYYGCYESWNSLLISSACSRSLSDASYYPDNPLYSKPSLEFCEKMFEVEDWMDIRDVTADMLAA